jgi:Protein of unknown function (DUF3999)
LKRSVMALALIAASALAGSQSFQHERTVTPGSKGANRLDVDVPLLAGSSPDLHDVRLIDGNARELGYLLIRPQSREPEWTRATLLAVASTKTTSGFEADLGALRDVDRIRFAGVRPPYLKHVTLEGSGDRSHWTMLADTTVFDLPDQRLRRPEIAFAPGEYRYLRVTWDDRSSARVSGVATAEARLHDMIAPPDPLRAALPFRKLSSEPGKSRYRIDLPGPNLPVDTVEVQVSGGDVFRASRVTEPQLTNGAITPVVLGTAQLRRAVRDGFVAAEMGVPITTPTGRELELVLDDGANAPLPVSSIVARFSAQPWIYFESPDGVPITARYGNQRVLRPQYDLEAARQFVGRSEIAAARWSSSPKQAVTSEQAETQAPLPALGPTIDRASFRYWRPLENAPRGLAVLPLAVDVLARSHDLADVRIVDAASHQVPYIVEHRDEPLKVTLSIPQRDETERGVSRYRLRLPYQTLPGGTRVVITTSGRVFERTVRIVRTADERRGRDEREIAQAEWRNSDPETAAAPLTFDVTLYGTPAIDLVVSEGDNAPLPISSVDILLPSYALRFEHPGGPLTLLYGGNTASAPRYDLALLAPRILTEPAREISTRKPATEGTPDERSEMKYFWIAIAVAAIVLLALFVRLIAPALREESRPLGETPGRSDPPR